MSEFKFDNKNEIFLEIEDLSRKQEEQQKRIKAYVDQMVSTKVNAIVDQLVAERKARGLTQADIAMRTGVATSNIARFELKKTIPTFQFLEKYAYAVGMEMEYKLK